MFRPSLSTIISENSKVVTVVPSDTVLTASKKMLELKMSSAVVAIESKPGGILTSRDILMRVIAQNLPPESTTVEKVMTQCPECASVDTPILDALHTMHDGKFLHLPVLDRDGNVVTVVDVLHITHAAIATVGNSGAAGSESTSAMMQRFWDSAMSIGPLDDDDDSTRSEGSTKVASEAADIGRSALFPASALSNTFGFKIQDKQGRMHRFNCETSSLTDLIAAVDHARQIGWKSLRLHLDYARRKRGDGSSDFEYAGKDAWASAYSAVAAGAALVAGLGVMAYLKRSG
ncbi:CBS domain-containing protein CBSCBSPB1 [Zea mays]|uniref:CBS domain-containing protein CBSCBSPB1 n=1 Tax=Zea mays TaxID=4577 RepID=A0A1D6G5T4_MAIZE|nr:CBS domain-containing protein CBSCBSPB1 [Zea mays]